MKKFIAIALLTLSLPMAAMASHQLPSIQAQAATVGCPSYVQWAPGHTFWAGYPGFVDMCVKYLTPENRAKVLEKKAYSPAKMNAAIKGTGQSVGQWLKVNPWK